MKLSRLVLFVVPAMLATIVVVYFLNPIGVPSRDPRGRLLGVIPYRAPSVSMEPTIPEGTFFLACTTAYWHSGPRVGDIVVFWSPTDPESPYVKRVVAVGGDSVVFRRSQFLRNGLLQREAYLQGEQDYPEPLALSVPQGSVFVAGDNRDHSVDSRHFGPVPVASIVGKLCAGS